MARIVSLVLLACALQVGAADTVTVTPAKPTIRDSLSFDLYSEMRCCVTAYHSDTVLVNDTTIVLSYEYDDSLCASVRRFLPGSHHEFVTGPVAAGTYGIYKMASMYCPRGRICPRGPIVMLRLGEVTVSGPNRVAGPQTTARVSAPARAAALRLDPSGQRVVVRAADGAFRLDGGRVSPTPRHNPARSTVF